MKRICQSCNAELPEGAPGNRCPKCLLSFGLEETSAELPDAGPGDRIGHYKLLQQIGEGGCGIVYMAEQLEPVRRRVALKVIKLGMDTKNVIARFEAERQALAMMDHPNIAKVLDAGATEAGRPFFVMELVRGIKITDYCDQNHLSTGERLNLFIQICQAIQHAHQKGIIHRDIKPSNILVTVNDGVPVPKVIDFGIAKATNQQPLTDKTVFTAFEQFIGTPAYMSPEQAVMTSLDIDTRSDIYSLGVLLYELLTGRTPFDNTDLLKSGLDEMRRIIREKDPVRPSTRLSTFLEADLTTMAHNRHTDAPKLVHMLRGDLDWIVMKCLEKDRTRRYETANGVLMDIQRHLNNEPIVARPPSAGYRLQKAYQRNKVAFAGMAAVSLALVLGAIVSGWQAAKATRAQGIANAAREKESQLRHQADAARSEAERARANEARLRAEAQAQALAERRRAYASDMNLVQRDLRLNKMNQAMNLLNQHRPKPGEEDLRGWEWRYLWQYGRSDALYTLAGPRDEISELAASSDGRWLAACSYSEPGLRLFNLQDGRRMTIELNDWIPQRCAFSPEQSILAVAGKATNGSQFSLRLWDITERKTLLNAPMTGFCLGLSFDREGKWLFSLSLTNGMQEEIAMWSVKEGRKIRGWPAPLPGVGDINIIKVLAVTSDGKKVVHRSGPDFIRLFETETGREIWSIRAADEMVSTIAISRDDKIIATGGAYAEGTIRLWDLATGNELGHFEGHLSWVADLAFLPDGRTLASAGADQTIRLWNIQTLKPIGVLNGHRGEVWRLVVLNDGVTVVSGEKHGSLLAWDTRTVAKKKSFSLLPERVLAWAISTDNQSIVSMDNQGKISRWGGESFHEQTVLVTTGLRPNSPSISPNGRLAADGANSGVVRIWDLSSRQLFREFNAHGKAAVASAFSDDGKYLKTHSKEEGFSKLWDVASGREITSWKMGSYADFISQDARWAMSVRGEDGLMTLRELASGRETRGVLDGLGVPYHARFSPDGSCFALASEPGPARFFNRLDLSRIAVVESRFIHSVGFSPDGKRFATGNAGLEAIKVWDFASKLDLLTLEGFGSIFIPTVFSADGNLLAASTSAGTVQLAAGWVLHIWRAPSWDEIAEAGEAGAR